MMPRISGERRTRQRGGTLVDSALIFIVYFLVVVGIMEFGRMVWVYNTIADLAREGSRYAAFHGTQSKAPADAAAVRNAVLAYAVALDPNALTVNTTWNPDKNMGSTVTVVTTYNFASMTGFVKGANMSSTSSMVISW